MSLTESQILLSSTHYKDKKSGFLTIQKDVSYTHLCPPYSRYIFHIKQDIFLIAKDFKSSERVTDSNILSPYYQLLRNQIIDWSYIN